jgi:hypothetical protein
MSEVINRRNALLVAGAAGLGVAALTPSSALASNWPKLDKALVEMKDAKTFLEKAEAKFGGHKKKAIEALNTAITEIEAAIEFASKK